MAPRGPKKRSRNPSPKKARPAWVRPFLAAYRESGNVSLSCEAAGVDRTMPYQRAKTDPTFKVDWDAAKEHAADLLVQEARRRARDGVTRLKFWQGDLITIPMLRDGRPVLDDKQQPVMVPYVEHEYSDVLLIFLLKGLRPAEYRDNFKHEHEHSGPGGGPIPHEHTVTGRIDQLAAAFEGAADRAGEGGVSGDGARKPLPAGPRQNGDHPETG